jgi:Zn-dependent protease
VELSFSSIVLIVLNLGLLWLLMAAPIGVRTLRLSRRFKAKPERIWSAIHPLGENANWHPSVIRSEPVGGNPNMARQVYDHLDRKGQPIERVLAISAVPDSYVYTAHVVEDSALDKAFWVGYEERRSLNLRPGSVELIVEQTDGYRGFAFLIFRYFALKREMLALDGWLATGTARKVGFFEHPMMQMAMAVLSTLLLWPFFGLSVTGLMMSSMLTIVIGLHELGHMAAYRAFGHRTARMIFIPLLGGIAIGGRPYNSLFEVATCALMGAGISAFLVPAAVFATHSLMVFPGSPQWAIQSLLFFTLVLGAFNLLNLLPMNRFDGGQVLRQIFSDKRLLALGSFCVAMVILITGWEIGLPGNALIAGLGVFILLSFIGAGRWKPRDDLEPITSAERLLVALGLYSAVILHSYAIVFACEHIFG